MLHGRNLYFEESLRKLKKLNLNFWVFLQLLQYMLNTVNFVSSLRFLLLIEHEFTTDLNIFLTLASYGALIGLKYLIKILNCISDTEIVY